MKLSEKILVVAEWLKSEQNELLIEANEAQLDTLALSLVAASDILSDVAGELQIEGEPDVLPAVAPDALEEMAALAASFDESGDELLQKQAAVLDEILLTLSAPKDYAFNFKKAEDAKIEALKDKYRSVKEELDKNIGVKEAVEALEKSPTYKEYRPMEHSLKTRYCPDHPGSGLSRIGNGDEWQCNLDHKLYDFASGYTTLKGDKVPAESVSAQTDIGVNPAHQMFDTRDQRLGQG